MPAPAVPIRVQNPAARAVPESLHAKGAGLIDTGANVSVVPPRAALELGIAMDESGKQSSLGAGGGFDSYNIEVGIQVWIGGRRRDIGVARALSPDTESSRRRGSRLPFLPGRDGFLDKFNVCFDEQDRTVWIRRNGGRDRRPRGGAVAGGGRRHKASRKARRASAHAPLADGCPS